MRRYHFKVKDSIDKLEVLGGIQKRGMRFWGGGDDKEESAPAKPALPSYSSFKPQRATDIEDQLYDFYKQRLDPSYQAITPDQQAMMFQRIQDQLSPTFEKQIKDQEQGIFTQGITGTPGASILGKLRQDYMKDLMGKATDIAIEDIGLTESGRQYGTGVLERLKEGLVGQGNTAYGGAMTGYGYDMGLYGDQLARNQQQQSGLWSGLGNLIGTGATYAMDAFLPGSGALTRGTKGVSNMTGGGSGNFFNPTQWKPTFASIPSNW